MHKPARHCLRCGPRVPFVTVDALVALRIVNRLATSQQSTSPGSLGAFCSRFAAQIVDCIGRQIAPNTLEYADFHPPNFASSVTQEHPIERLGRISAFGRCWQMTAGDAGLETKVEITPAGDLLSTANPSSVRSVKPVFKRECAC